MKTILQKIILLCLFITGSVIQAVDIRDENGRTFLMNNVIKNEQDRQDVRKSQNYYQFDRLLSGCIGLIWPKIGQEMHDASQQYYNNRQNQYASLLNNVRGAVQLYTPEQLSMQATDKQGKTALNHCKTEDMYNLLRSHGAPFQYDAFLYIHGKKCILSTVAVGLFGCIAYQVYKK